MVLCVHEYSGRSVSLPLAPLAPVAALAASETPTLAQAIWLSGEIAPPALCSGLGRCGACRVRFLQGHPEPVDADRQVLGDTAVAQGWRLACRHPARAGMDVELPPPPAARTEPCARTKREDVGTRTDTAGSPIRLAVDLGTTSIHWQAFDADGVFLRGQALNPQLGAGSDVVSRLAFARTVEGRAVLRTLILQFLQRIVTEIQATAVGAPLERFQIEKALLTQRDVFPQNDALKHSVFQKQKALDELCVAGNSALTAILLDLDTSGLAAAPYHLPEHGEGGETVALPGLPPVWIPPQPAPFVGGDISAGMATLLYAQEPRFPFLFADLGTNGECVLALDAQRSLVTSVPLGPALEGIGLTYGGVADSGSVSGFRLGPKGLLPQVIGGGPAQRLCGTGYLSLLHVLLRTGVLASDGRLAADGASLAPLARRVHQSVRFDATGAWALPLSGGGAESCGGGEVGALWLTAFDVEEILKVKAAFSLALERLLAEAGLAFRELTQVTLGGALGEHAPVDALEALGFLPSGLGGRVRAAGNTSLAGATLLLQRPALRAPLIRWSRQCRVLDLTARADFTEQYLRHMFFG